MSVSSCLTVLAALWLAGPSQRPKISAEQAETLIFDAARKELEVPTLQVAETIAMYRRALTADKFPGALGQYCRLRLALADHLGTKNAPGLARRYEQVAAGPGDDALSTACQLAARRALARLRIGRLRQVLRQYFLSEIEYPAALDGLVRAGLAQPGDLTDPWGKPFGYEALPAELFPDVARQRYRLWAEPLGREPPDLAAELGSIRNLVSRIRLAGVARSPQGRPTVRLRLVERDKRTRRRPLTFTIGDKVLDLKLVGVRAHGIFLASPDVVVAVPSRPAP